MIMKLLSIENILFFVAIWELCSGFEWPELYNLPKASCQEAVVASDGNPCYQLLAPPPRPRSSSSSLRHFRYNYYYDEDEFFASIILNNNKFGNNKLLFDEHGDRNKTVDRNSGQTARKMRNNITVMTTPLSSALSFWGQQTDTGRLFCALFASTAAPKPTICNPGFDNSSSHHEAIDEAVEYYYRVIFGTDAARLRKAYRDGNKSSIELIKSKLLSSRENFRTLLRYTCLLVYAPCELSKDRSRDGQDTIVTLPCYSYCEKVSKLIGRQPYYSCEWLSKEAEYCLDGESYERPVTTVGSDLMPPVSTIIVEPLAAVVVSSTLSIVSLAVLLLSLHTTLRLPSKANAAAHALVDLCVVAMLINCMDLALCWGIVIPTAGLWMVQLVYTLLKIYISTLWCLLFIHSNKFFHRKPMTLQPGKVEKSSIALFAFILVYSVIIVILIQPADEQPLHTMIWLLIAYHLPGFLILCGYLIVKLVRKRRKCRIRMCTAPEDISHSVQELASSTIPSDQLLAETSPDSVVISRTKKGGHCEDLEVVARVEQAAELREEQNVTVSVPTSKSLLQTRCHYANLNAQAYFNSKHFVEKRLENESTQASRCAVMSASLPSICEFTEVGCGETMAGSTDLSHEAAQSTISTAEAKNFAVSTLRRLSLISSAKNQFPLRKANSIPQPHKPSFDRLIPRNRQPHLPTPINNIRFPSSSTNPVDSSPAMLVPPPSMVRSWSANQEMSTVCQPNAAQSSQQATDPTNSVAYPRSSESIIRWSTSSQPVSSDQYWVLERSYCDSSADKNDRRARNKVEKIKERAFINWMKLMLIVIFMCIAFDYMCAGLRAYFSIHRNKALESSAQVVSAVISNLPYFVMGVSYTVVSVLIHKCGVMPPCL